MYHCEEVGVGLRKVNETFRCLLKVGGSYGRRFGGYVSNINVDGHTRNNELDAIMSIKNESSCSWI